MSSTLLYLSLLAKSHIVIGHHTFNVGSLFYKIGFFVGNDYVIQVEGQAAAIGCIVTDLADVVGIVPYGPLYSFQNKIDNVP